MNGRLKRIVCPYFVWGLMMICVYFASLLVLGECRPDFSFKILIDPFVDLLLVRPGTVIGPLWFLPVLFVVELVYWFTEKISKSWIACLAMCGCCYCLYDMLEPLYWNGRLPWMIAFLPRWLFFIYMGRIVISRNLPEWMGVNKWFVVGVGCLLLALSSLTPVWDMLKSISGSYRAGFFVSSTFAMVGVSLFARIINFHWLAAVGRDSLGILVMHKFVIVAFQGALPIHNFCFGHGLVLTLITVVFLSYLSVLIPYFTSQWLRIHMSWVIGEFVHKQSLK